MRENGRVGVIGAGSWGTTLAHLLASKDYRVDLWVRETDLCRIIAERHENPDYLAGFRVSENITPHNDLEPVVRGHDLLFMVVPSHVYRQVAERMARLIQPGTVVVNASKGIENETLLTMSGIWKSILPNAGEIEVLCLSGPSFAVEVIKELPSAVTLAGENMQTLCEVQRVASTSNFRVYTSLDRIGVELAGALKNVIALAAGACDGLGLGHNTRAALITRGLAEIARLGVKMGANPFTFSGLAGIGDLVLTCTGDLSRNRTVGMQLGQGRKIKDILGEMRMVAEGVKTTRSACFLARRMDVEMPITERVYQVLYEDKNPRDAVRELMERDLKPELDNIPYCMPK